jgi:DNA polymerase III alpha subunit (gram-positive type)
MNVKNKQILICRTNVSGGFMTVTELIDAAVEMGLPAIGIMDVQSVRAFPEAMRAAEKHMGKIKILYGAEFAVLKTTPASVDKYDFYCFAQNQQGLQNLYRLVSAVREHEFENRRIKPLTEPYFRENHKGLLLGFEVALIPRDSRDRSRDHETWVEILQDTDFFVFDGFWKREPDVARADYERFPAPICAANYHKECDGKVSDLCEPLR